MARYRDFLFKQGDYVKMQEVTDDAAIINAIKTIMLSRPGNFPFTPGMGMNIQKYQFDILDKQQVDVIRSDLMSQISKYIPDLAGIEISVEIVRDEETNKQMLGVFVSSRVEGEPIGSGILFYENQGEVQVIDGLE